MAIGAYGGLWMQWMAIGAYGGLWMLMDGYWCLWRPIDAMDGYRYLYRGLWMLTDGYWCLGRPIDANECLLVPIYTYSYEH